MHASEIIGHLDGDGQVGGLGVTTEHVQIFDGGKAGVD